MAIGWHGTQRQSHTHPEPTPATCLPPRAKTALALRVWRPPHNAANWGAFFSPSCGDQVPVTVLLTGTQTAGRETGEGEGPGGCSCPGLASPSWAQGQRHRSFSWLDGASLQEDAWEKSLRYLSLRVKTTQEQPHCGGGTPGGEPGVGSSLPAQVFRLRVMERWPFSSLRTSVPKTKPWPWKRGCRMALNPAFGGAWGGGPRGLRSWAAGLVLLSSPGFSANILPA